MPKKIALDFDTSELRIVVANCSGSRVDVTAAEVITLDEGVSASEKLRGYINEHQLQNTETLVAIGRGKAELRELQLPPVADEELPDMVRFQAIRSFASASDRAIVDFLPTGRTEEGNTLIAAAVSPQALSEIEEMCATSGLIPKRVALRPLTAASLYLRQSDPPAICVMIDLLPQDAEIVVARNGKVIFVRTVRLPDEGQYRPAAIASELRRTMVACGESSTPDRIVVWGTAAVHAQDVAAIREEIGIEDVQAVDPFSLVNLQVSRDSIPEHVGRLAPLVGLLSADDVSPETIIDFLNPRERPEEEPDRLRRALLIAGPVVLLFLVGFFVYRQFAEWDRKIANVTNEINMLLPSAEAADRSIARTEKIDQFLDRDVNWLDELRRFAKDAPPSDQLIVETIYATADLRNGGGEIRFTGTVTSPAIIDDLEDSIRDENHSVIGKGSQERKDSEGYRWDFNETITVSSETMRNVRYQRMAERELAQSDADSGESQSEPPADEVEAPESDSSETVKSEPENVDPIESGGDEVESATESEVGADSEKEVSA